MRDDSPWDVECFRLKNIRIRRTVSRKIKIELELVNACLGLTLGVSVNLRGKMIYEGYGDHRGRTGQALAFFLFSC